MRCATATNRSGMPDVRLPVSEIKRLTARSVVLSVLLGAHPARASAAELIRLTDDFGIKEQTLRVALTRMVGAGDLVRSPDGYLLADRLLSRQRRQDAAINPQTTTWDGTWTTVVITTVGAHARARAELRNDLVQNRFGELREGLWMRPNNLPVQIPADIAKNARILHSRDDDAVGLTALLWDLPAWSRSAHNLLVEMDGAADMPGRFAVAAAIVRHLLTDPVLPTELLPGDWPGADLRAAYAAFVAELAERRDQPREAI